MRKRRIDLEIYAIMLKAIAERNGITKTHIMYYANISYRQLQIYLALLLKLDLIRQVERGGIISYEITDKGKLFLEHYGKARELLTVKKQTTVFYDK